jgi:hypothetical protein
MTWLDRLFLRLIAAGVMLATAAVLSGCESEKKPVPAFELGSYVKMKVSGVRGMVIGAKCWTGNPRCFYEVRFPSISTITDTHLLSKDGAIETAPVSSVDFIREYELEASK